ncbi:MAG TPA: hypothetical protein VJ957_03700 [Longimicrobiales bacterium]|nr:hypothetical protein [Longimicrobiales bacterium]
MTPARFATLAAALAALVTLADCKRPPPVLPRIQAAARPDMLAGCYELRYGGPTYRSTSWPDDWRSRFIAPERFAVAPLPPRPGRTRSRAIVIPLTWDGAEKPRINARLTSDADSILFASGVHSAGVVFRLALHGDTLPGVAALAGHDDLTPARTVRRVMAVRVHCRSGEPLSLQRTEPRP